MGDYGGQLPRQFLATQLALYHFLQMNAPGENPILQKIVSAIILLINLYKEGREST